MSVSEKKFYREVVVITSVFVFLSVVATVMITVAHLLA